MRPKTENSMGTLSTAFTLPSQAHHGGFYFQGGIFFKALNVSPENLPLSQLAWNHKDSLIILTSHSPLPLPHINK